MTGSGLHQPMLLTDEQREFRAVMRRFADERIAPGAAERDRTATYDRAAFDACVEMGLPSLGIPEAYGGQGADAVTQAIMVEELARACASTALTILISKLPLIPVLEWGTEDQRQRYAPRIASGEWQGSYCLSEADAGSDAGAMRTRAVRDGDEWVLTGTKQWITNAGISDLYLVFAKTDLDAGHRGISAFLVEKEWGVETIRFEEKMGMKASPTGEIRLDGVRVPAANLVGEEGRGFHLAMATLDRSRPTIGAQAVGIAQGALDVAAGYLGERKAFGGTLADLQGLQFMVADAAMRIESARTMVHRACALIDAGDPHGDLTVAGAMAKCLASDTAMAVTTDAVQLLGGYGYTRDFPVERMMRDAKVTQIYEGTNQIQRVVISRHVLGAARR